MLVFESMASSEKDVFNKPGGFSCKVAAEARIPRTEAARTPSILATDRAMAFLHEIAGLENDMRILFEDVLYGAWSLSCRLPLSRDFAHKIDALRSESPF